MRGLKSKYAIGDLKVMQAQTKTNRSPDTVMTKGVRPDAFKNAGISSERMKQLERLKKYCSRANTREESGLFKFWLRFGSVAGHCGHAPSPKPRQNLQKNPRFAWLQYFFNRSCLSACLSSLVPCPEARPIWIPSE